MNDKSLEIIVKGLSTLAIIAGGFGMLYCAPYLWSSKMEILVGAGFPFVGGAILFASGLISLAFICRNKG